jgi:hypothetical protein
MFSAVSQERNFGKVDFCTKTERFQSFQNAISALCAVTAPYFEHIDVFAQKDGRRGARRKAVSAWVNMSKVGGESSKLSGEFAGKKVLDRGRVRHPKSLREIFLKN